MQRILAQKFLSKITRTRNNPFSFKVSPFSSKPVNGTHHPNRHFFSEYATWASSPLNRAFSDKIPPGFLLNRNIPKYCLRDISFKNQGKRVYNGTLGFWRARFVGRNFHSFDAGRRSWKFRFQRLTVDGVVLGLIITNVAIFLLWHVADSEFMKKNFMISVSNILSGRLHTLITSAFSHKDVGHLAVNMIGLYFFGTHIGGALGPQYLLKMYLAGALAGSVFYLVHHAFFAPSLEGKGIGRIDPSQVHGLGASGATNAIMLLDIFLFPKQTLYLEFIIPVPAILLGIFIIGNDLLRVLKGDSHVSGSAHLGGAAVAALAWYQIRRGRFRF